MAEREESSNHQSSSQPAINKTRIDDPELQSKLDTPLPPAGRNHKKRPRDSTAHDQDSDLEESHQKRRRKHSDDKPEDRRDERRRDTSRERREDRRRESSRDRRRRDSSRERRDRRRDSSRERREDRRRDSSRDRRERRRGSSRDRRGRSSSRGRRSRSSSRDRRGRSPSRGRRSRSPSKDRRGRSSSRDRRGRRSSSRDRRDYRRRDYDDRRDERRDDRYKRDDDIFEGDSIEKEKEIRQKLLSGTGFPEFKPASADIAAPSATDAQALSVPDEQTVAPRIPIWGTASMLACRSVDDYEIMCVIGDGTYGVVYKAKDIKTGEIVALKKVKMDKEREGFPITSLREVRALMQCKHQNIVNMKEIVIGRNDSVYIAMEYLEHDLRTLMEDKGSPFSISEIKCLMLQLLSAVEYLHENWVVHRDIKTSNLLLNNNGYLKLCDFGLAREYSSPLRPMTQLVVTLWYRAPELLLGSKVYGPAVDMWSVGCVFAELLQNDPIFKGQGELDQLDKIFKMLGTPNDRIWPGFSELPYVKKVKFATQPYNHLRSHFSSLSDKGFDLLNRMLTYDPNRRIKASEALRHPWFDESPLPKDPEMMPTWPSRTDGRPRRSKRPGSREEAERLMQEHGMAGQMFDFGGEAPL